MQRAISSAQRALSTIADAKSLCEGLLCQLESTSSPSPDQPIPPARNECNPVDRSIWEEDLLGSKDSEPDSEDDIPLAKRRITMSESRVIEVISLLEEDDIESNEAIQKTMVVETEDKQVKPNDRDPFKNTPQNYSPGAHGFVFTDPTGSRQFKRHLSGNKKLLRTLKRLPGLSQTTIQKKAKELLHEWTRPDPQEQRKEKDAWHHAAMAWRLKNMPSGPELEEARKAAASATATARTNSMKTPAQRAKRDREHIQLQRPQLLSVPDKDAAENERRCYYRAVAQQKAELAVVESAVGASFASVLCVFGVPCASNEKTREAYRIAVRMYHPDSNSKDRAWSNLDQRIECEEIMKVINEMRGRLL